MKTFVKYNKAGEILSVSKVEIMPEGLAHPYLLINEDEAVLEAPNRKEFRELEPLQLHEQYHVDVAKAKLVKKK